LFSAIHDPSLIQPKWARKNGLGDLAPRNQEQHQRDYKNATQRRLRALSMAMKFQPDELTRQRRQL